MDLDLSSSWGATACLDARVAAYQHGFIEEHSSSMARGRGLEHIRQRVVSCDGGFVHCFGDLEMAFVGEGFLS